MLFDYLSKFLKGILLAIPNIPLIVLWSSERTVTEKVVGTLVWLVLIVVIAILVTRWRARRLTGDYPL